MTKLAGKTVFVTGSSRGIGKAIALRVAREGANVVITGKTDRPHERLPGTIQTAAAEVEAEGGRALAVRMDVRHEEDVSAAVERAVAEFGRLDVLVNNAGAIALTRVRETPMKRFDLMHAVNVRAAYLTTRCCLEHLARSENPHILNLSPPLNLAPRWLGPHIAYTISKFSMSLLTLGASEDLRADGIAVNSLWPVTLIATSAIRFAVGDEEMMSRCRTPEILAEAAHWIVTQRSRDCTGNLFTDEEIHARMGRTDLSAYAVDPSRRPLTDLFIDPA